MLTTDDSGFEAALEKIVEADEQEALAELAEETEEATPETEAETESDSEESDSEESDDTELEDSEDEETEAGHDEPSTFTVKVDGKDMEVTLDDLKRGYSGQQYIQKGMQENAEVRKRLESEIAQLQQAQQQVVKLYQEAQSGDIPRAPTPPPRDLFDSDPIGYMEAKIKYDEDKANYDTKMQQVAQMREQAAQREQFAKKQKLQQEVSMLIEKIPSLKEGDNAQKAVQKFVETGSIYGYSPEEVNAVMDHRAMMMLHDLAKYRELINNKEQARVKSRPKNQPIKPGAMRPKSNRTAVDKQRNKLQRTGSIEDALSLILDN